MVKQALLAMLIIFLLMQNAYAAIRFDRAFDVSEGQYIFNKSFCGGCDVNACRENIDKIARNPDTGRFNLTDQPIQNNRYGIYTLNKYIASSSTDYLFTA